MKAAVNKIIHSSVVDGPGNRAVVFFQGCNYRCKYCHNPETIALCNGCGKCVAKCPMNALKESAGKLVWDEKKCCQCDLCIQECPYLASPRTKDYTPENIMEEIQGDIPFIRGITVSGGECSLYRDFVLGLFQLAKNKNMTTLMDSNGSYDFSKDQELLDLCDGVMLDVKSYHAKTHKKLTGCDNEMVLRQAEFLAKHGKLEEIRTVVVPGYLSNEETVGETAKFLRPYLEIKSIRYKIIAYRPFGVRKPYKDLFTVPTKDDMRRCGEIAAKNGFKDIVLV